MIVFKVIVSFLSFFEICTSPALPYSCALKKSSSHCSYKYIYSFVMFLIHFFEITLGNPMAALANSSPHAIKYT